MVYIQYIPTHSNTIRESLCLLLLLLIVMVMFVLNAIENHAKVLILPFLGPQKNKYKYSTDNLQ